MSKLLIADDEPRVVRLLSRLLAGEGHTPVPAHDGGEALEVLRVEHVDLVLLDLVMPRCHGLQVLTELRGSENVPPVIVLSAVHEVAVRVQALDLGAIDFVQKPFHTAELMARVRRHLSPVPRQRSEAGARVIRAGDFELDLVRRRARGGGVDVVLSTRESVLLAHLMRRQGLVCAKDELLLAIWGPSLDGGSNVVEVCIRRLRTKLGEPPIETVRGVGYCWAGE